MTTPERARTTRRALTWDQIGDNARVEYTADGAAPVIVRITGRTDTHLHARPTGTRTRSETVIPRADVDAGRVARVRSRSRSIGYADVPGGVLGWCRRCDWEAPRPQSTKAAAEYVFQTRHRRCPDDAVPGGTR